MPATSKIPVAKIDSAKENITPVKLFTKRETAIRLEVINERSSEIDSLAREKKEEKQLPGYIRHTILDDGDCGYTAFGITREDAYKKLKEEIQAVNAAGLLKPMVHELLLEKNFVEYIAEKNLIAKNIALKDIEEKIDSYTNDINIQAACIDYDVKDKKAELGWAHPATLQALAHIQGLEIYLWMQGEDQRLIPFQRLQGEAMIDYAYYKSTHLEKLSSAEEKAEMHAQQRIDLLFINNNHFERLEFEGFDKGFPATGDIVYLSCGQQGYAFEDACSVTIIEPEKLPAVSCRLTIAYAALSFLMMAISVATAYFMVDAIANDTEGELDDRGLNPEHMQLTVIYGLLSGATLQLAMNFLPISSVSEKFNHWKNVPIPLEAALFKNIADIFYPIYSVGEVKNYIIYKELSTPWAAMRYGCILAEIATKFILRCYKQSPVIIAQTATDSYAESILQQQIQLAKDECYFNKNQYKTLGWLAVFLTSTTGIVIPYVINLEKVISPTFGYFMDLMISSLGYGGMGYILGDLLENVTHSTKLDKLHTFSFYTYGLFAKPGNYYYNNLTIAAGGLLIGWSTAYSRRQMNIQFSLRNEQIHLLKPFLLGNVAHSPLTSQLKKLKALFQQEDRKLIKQRRYFKWIFIAAAALIPPCSNAYNSGLTVLEYFLYGYSAIGSYYLSRYVRPDSYFLKPFSKLSLFLNENIILISQLGLISILSRNLTRLLYLSNSADNEGLDASRCVGYFFWGILGGTYYMHFCENEKSVVAIDLARFSKLMAHLSPEKKQKNIRHLEEKIQLTSAEVLFIASNLEDDNVANNIKNASIVPEAIFNISNKNCFFQPAKLEIIPGEAADKKLKEKATISAIVLPFITEEFSFQTINGEYFRF